MSTSVGLRSSKSPSTGPLPRPQKEGDVSRGLRGGPSSSRSPGPGPPNQDAGSESRASSLGDVVAVL